MNEPLTVELSVDLNNDEVTLLREAISQANSDWQAAALQLFASLRERRCRYQARQLSKGYNAIL
jgi:hypothetical protein